MTYKPGILLGQITKTSGFEGAVLVRLEKRFVENIPEPESVFLEIEGRPVPFFISSFEYPGADLLKLSFEGYTSVDRVEEFKGCNVFLTTTGEDNSIEPDLSLLRGFKLTDQQKRTIGEISEIISNPGQLLLEIISEGNEELLIPFHEDLIIKIDRRRRIVVMEIPEGLLDINK
jgi:16S rRNA processing protein RimM